MDIKKQTKLFKKFPEFFEHLKEYDGDVVLPMMFGFEIGDGWYNLLYNLMETIHNYCEWNDKPYPQFTQVKEKYGSLEVYIYGGDNMIDGMIWFANSLSTHICESCGSMENVGQTEKWIYTRCETCYKNEKITQPFKKWEI